MPSERDLPPDWKEQLPPGAIIASRISECDLDGHRITISKALIGLREVWLVAIVDRKGRISLRGPGAAEPSEGILSLLVGQHRASVMANNARNN